MMSETSRKPGVRIDGGTRRDMNKERVASRMAALPDHAPTPEQAAARRKTLADRERREKKAALKGHAGMEVRSVSVKISGERSARRNVRCRSGSFEWRFGTSKNSDHRRLYDAGIHVAQLWERAGMAIPSSADMLRGTASGYRTGISEGRLAAIDQLEGIKFAMGHGRMERLIDYVVAGMTANEIAAKHGIGSRDIPAILHQDLRDCWDVTFGPKAGDIREARREAQKRRA